MGLGAWGLCFSTQVARFMLTPAAARSACRRRRRRSRATASRRQSRCTASYTAWARTPASPSRLCKRLSRFPRCFFVTFTPRSYENIGWPLYKRYGHGFEGMRQILADPNVLSNYGITEEVKFNVIEKANKVLLTPNPQPPTPNPKPRPGAAQQGLQAAAHARQRTPSQV